MRALPALLLLAACAEFPTLDARIPAAERAAPPPALVPLTGLLGAADALPPQPGFAPALAAQAQALSARAGGLPAAGAASDAARLAELRARAAALQDGVLTPEERARLEAGPSLP